MDLALDPLLGGFGARVDHDLTDTSDPHLPEALTAALHRHRLLVFPGQHLNHGDLLSASSLFGNVDTDIDRRYAVAGFPGAPATASGRESRSATRLSQDDCRDCRTAKPSRTPSRHRVSERDHKNA
jgi:taurine dioxygenase